MGFFKGNAGEQEESCETRYFEENTDSFLGVKSGSQVIFCLHGILGKGLMPGSFCLLTPKPVPVSPSILGLPDLCSSCLTTLLVRKSSLSSLMTYRGQPTVTEGQ